MGEVNSEKKKKVTHKNGLNVKVAHKKNVFAVNICVLVKKIYIFYNHQALMLQWLDIPRETTALEFPSIFQAASFRVLAPQ